MNKNFLNALDDWGTILTDTFNDHYFFTPETDIDEEGNLIIGKGKYKQDSEQDKQQITGPMEILEGVKYIKEFAFKNCTKLTVVNVPDTLEHIDKYAFQNCEELSEIKFNEGLTYIGDGAFSGCYELKSINLPSTLDYIRINTFENCGLEGDLTLPGNLEMIQDNAFRGCYNLNGKLVIGDGIKVIGEAAFWDCSFTGELVIPESVKWIRPSAFSGCKFSKIHMHTKIRRGYINGWLQGCKSEVIYY